MAAVLWLLRYNRASGSVVETWVSFDRSWPCQPTSTLRPAGGSDGGGLTDSDTFTLNITGGNDAPVLAQPAAINLADTAITDAFTAVT